MGPPEALFLLLAFLVVYTYALYPLLIATAAAIRPRPVRVGPFSGSVSVVVAAYNEEAAVARRLRELADLVSAPGLDGEVILVSDGSKDRTAEVARSLGLGRVRVVELNENRGKAEALNAGCDAARGDILIFADARQTWAPDALSCLLRNFADPEVGAVSGELVLEDAPGVLAGVGFYWRYEKWLRARESRVHSTVGVTGAICATRRDLFRPIPRGTILDDVFWPLHVALRGARVVYDRTALAHDRLPAQARDEFRRKVRTLSGNLQLLGLVPEALLPWRNPIWFQLVSHKLLRLAVPWALIGLLALAATQNGALFRAALWAQLACYAIGLAGMVRGIGSRSRLASAAASFLVLNAAAWVAAWVWASGRASRSWSKAVYTPRPRLLDEPEGGRVGP